MELEDSIFKADFYYRPRFINYALAIIKFSKNERRRTAYRRLVFSMMKDVVKKNCFNYLNMLSKLNLREDKPSIDELVADCFVIFEKCIEKYRVHRNNNFYFYYNKSLARSFFRDYQRSFRETTKLTATEAVITVVPRFHSNGSIYDIELVMENIGFSELEKNIIKSKILGVKSSEFLKKNTEVTQNEYSRTMKRIRDILTKMKNNGEF